MMMMMMMMMNNSLVLSQGSTMPHAAAAQFSRDCCRCVTIGLGRRHGATMVDPGVYTSGTPIRRRARTRGLTRDPARQTNVSSGPAPGRVILQLPDLYGNIISSALDVIIEPDETTDACVRKF